MAPTFPKSKYWTLSGIALVAFAAGLLTAGGVFHLKEVRAESNRAFELRIYHALPGKMPEHDLKAVGYWVTEGDVPAWDNKFIFIVDHRSLEEAKEHWQAFRTDPAFQEELKSEQANKLVEKVDSTYMRPTDFSPMK
jgi:hypothetical protein